jgi:hypothetical protein
MITVLTLTSPLVNAVIVDISVETDKETYLLDEPVTVFVTAYNPNTEAVTLYLDNFMKVSYLMDDIFDWREDKVYVPLPLVVTIEPYDFSTWDISHGQREMELYPLDIGIHSVIGEVIGYGYSSPIEFEVVPEPATVLLLGMGIVCMRPNKKVND